MSHHFQLLGVKRVEENERKEIAAQRKAEMQNASKSEITQELQPQQLKCVICGKPTMRLVDGEPSCDYHANQVYEHQIEDYARKHQF